MSNPTPNYVRGSLAWHTLMGAGAIAMPAAWPAWLTGIAANHLLICAASMTPRSRLIGPNITRLPVRAAQQEQVVLTFDDGPDPHVTPKVLGMLADAGVRATFFCIGERLLEQPALARQILAHGHTIHNHTQTHNHRFAFRGPNGLRAEIEQAQEVAWQLTGQRPIFFRAPAGMRNPFLQPVLANLGLHLVSWTRRGFDTQEKNARRVLMRLQRNLAAGDILLLHDGHAARTRDNEAVVLSVLPKLLERLENKSLRCVTLDEGLQDCLPETSERTA